MTGASPAFSGAQCLDITGLDIASPVFTWSVTTSSVIASSDTNDAASYLPGALRRAQGRGHAAHYCTVRPFPAPYSSFQCPCFFRASATSFGM
jgi:hypothetical protein